MLFEISGVNEATAREACRLAANKIGVRTRFVSRQATAA
jgi:large subunit ribosomal protein L16